VLGLLVAVGVTQARPLQQTVLPVLVGLRSVPIIAITPLLTHCHRSRRTGAGHDVALICFFPIVDQYNART